MRETGSNLPDIDILIALSDLYQVDIRQILDGERKPTDQPHPESREVLERVAQYTTIKEKNLVSRFCFLAVLGIVSLAVSVLIDLDMMRAITGGSVFLILTLIGFCLYCICMAAPKANRSPDGLTVILCGGFGAMVISNIAIVLSFFRDGSYHNDGTAGLFTAVGITLSAFLAAAGAVLWLTHRKEHR